MKVGLSGESSLFELISGFTITEQFNETLDNATIKFRANHRLNIKPYDEVCFDNGHCMLVDNFVETQESLITEQYLYTVNLMSLTKWLEKIQLPNRVITHSLVNGQTSIYSYINWYVDLYAPKIKMLNNNNTWSYKKLFVNKLSYDKYNVKCRDLQFSKPTLRQALTTLMLQIGCIPVLKKNQITGEIELHDIDFRTKGNYITQLDNYCNYITRSNASDSYVNTLRSVSENVLDDENVVISETLGFRDSDNIFIKQKENLKLTTRFPIYKVEKFSIVMLGTGILSVKQVSPLIENGNIYLAVGIEDKASGGVNIGITNVNIAGQPALLDVYTNVNVIGKLYLYNISQEEGNVGFLDSFRAVIDINAEINEESNIIATNDNVSKLTIGAIFIGTITATNISSGETITGAFEVGSAYESSVSVLAPEITQVCNIRYPYKKDITPLCVEQSKRVLLDTNFLEMQTVSTLEELAQYIYATVGYKIGTNVIEGFSQTYERAIGWWSAPYTYIENIVNTIINLEQPVGLLPERTNFSGEYLEQIKQQKLGDLNSSGIFISNFTNRVDSSNFTSLSFDVEYKPLNQLNITHSKEDIEINIPIEQYDSSDNSISTFNDIVDVEQQKVNRLGNDIITINQRIPLSANETGYELNDRILGEYIIFKKEIQYNPYDIQIVYTASKDYVLQNFFTAIQTKYRAYEYVDYGQSVLRQENTTIYGLIDRFYINADDQIKWGGVNTYNLRLDSLLLSALDNTYSYNMKYVCCGVGSTDTYYKNDLSILKSKNSITFVTKLYDSVSYGQKLIPSTETLEALGGYEQEWYIDNNLLNKTIFISQYTGLDLLSLVNSVDVATMQQNVYNLPLMHNVETKINEYGEETDINSLMFLVNDNTTTTNIKTYYLDQQELLNQTIQFQFYTTDSGIKWTEKLWELCNLTSDKPKGNKYIYIGVDEEFGINENGYTNIDTTKLVALNENLIQLFSGLLLQTGSGFTINWSNIATSIDFMKVVYEENGIYYDLIAVERVGNNASDTIYISLNDTKSLKVGSQRNGCLTFNEYEVAKNTLNRNVKKL